MRSSSGCFTRTRGPGRRPTPLRDAQRAYFQAPPKGYARAPHGGPMEATGKGWGILDRERAILWRQYSFGPGLATTLVFRGADDGLIVISPGSGVDPAALDELADFGKVVALVASNGYHWLGQSLWRKRFPLARSFSPTQGIA